MDLEGYCLAVAFLLALILESSATKCYQCVYFSNMDEDEPLRFQQKLLSAFTSGHYDGSLFYKKLNTRQCFYGPSRAVESKVLVSECPAGCQTYYREEKSGKYVIIRSCGKPSGCMNERFMDDAEARQTRCCESDQCNNAGVTRATRCHRCLYNENMKTGETFKSHHEQLDRKPTSGLSTKDVERMRLGFHDTIPNDGVCKYNPWDTEQVLCTSKTCSKMEFWRVDEKHGHTIHTIVRDCLPPGKTCQTNVDGASINCCMETVCNSTSYLYFSWTLLIGFLGCILLH